MWQALKLKFQGSVSMIKSKKALIKKEFDIFTGMKGETTKQLIECYCHLVVEMKRLEITKTNEEWINKLSDALPYDEWGTYLMMLKNNSDFVNLNLSSFIEKIEAHELEMLKIKKMNSANVQQDVSLYYKGSTPIATNQSPKIQTGFSVDTNSSASTNTPQSNKPSPFVNYDPNFKAQQQPSPQSSTSSNNQDYVSGVQCNIAVNIKNGNEITETAAKQHIALLASVLEAYEGLVAGRIVRRAQHFVEITGRNSLSGPDQKLGFGISKVTCFKRKERGHFKRECPNREVNNHQNPFTNDYYRQAIYHRPNQQPAVQRPQIENKPEKALIVNQDDEKVAEGFTWDKYIHGSDGQAMMAEIVEVPEMVTEPEMVVEDVPVDNVVDIEEIAVEFYYYQSEQEVLASSMKSIMPPKVFESFVGYFEEPTTGSCPRYEEKKEVVEEMIDVTKELTGEILKDIADKALMGKLKEVDSELEKSESVSTVSVKQESDQKSGVQEVKVSKSELKNVGKQDVKIVCDEQDDLPESIDVTFSASDTDNESQVIKTVVDQVLDEESDNSEKSQSEKSVSESEDEGNFLDRFIPKSDKSANDDSIMVGLPRSILSKWIIDSGASRHMTGTLALLYDVKSINGSYVGFTGNQGGRIVGQGTLTNGVISFEKANYIVELENNLLSILQICDKSSSVHVTNTECVVLKSGFKIPDEMVLLRASRENDLVQMWYLIHFTTVVVILMCKRIQNWLSSILEFMSRIPILKALTDQHPLYKSHIKRFWKHSKYDEENKAIHSIVKVHNEKKEIVVTEALIREVVNFPDDAESPTKFPERKSYQGRVRYNARLSDEHGHYIGVEQEI
ncbi:uncharacterized protein LOC110924731 [Helianthus annuus]|uniref:uncharacterized protein LOC110924731 n=1 Tax=Helianthus annuus TaxID=4232 RepID=UPI000B900924|nr:uncharacterized protein LOC110924731 [Helianthus annuus]